MKSEKSHLRTTQGVEFQVDISVSGLDTINHRLYMYYILYIYILYIYIYIYIYVLYINLEFLD